MDISISVCESKRVGILKFHRHICYQSCHSLAESMLRCFSPRHAVSNRRAIVALALFVVLCIAAAPHSVSIDTIRFSNPGKDKPGITYGVRPYWLLQHMSAGPLRDELMSCRHQTPRKALFTIGHRGAPLQFPEHTVESYTAAAQMGAGVLECDVTFTSDLHLVCRHSQCDLHTTTNILLTPLASKCTRPFKSAGNGTNATAKCCTSDITLAEFRTLRGKMDASYDNATTAHEYVTRGTPGWRTNLYATSGTLITHSESIALFRRLGAQMIPELKEPSVQMPFRKLTQRAYALKLVAEYVAAGVDARDVRLQSGDLADIRTWISAAPAFGRRAVYLDKRYKLNGFDPAHPNTIVPSFSDLYRQGLRVIAPPIWVLLRGDGKTIRPSAYAMAARQVELEIITWTAERAGAPPSGFYVRSYAKSIRMDGDMYKAIDVLARKVNVLGIFTDWAATITYYANCVGIP